MFLKLSLDSVKYVEVIREVMPYEDELRGRRIRPMAASIFPFDKLSIVFETWKVQLTTTT